MVAMYAMNSSANSLKSSESGISNTARQIVETHQMHYKNGISLTSQDCGNLQAAILAHSAYHGADTQPTSGLGIA